MTQVTSSRGRFEPSERPLLLVSWEHGPRPPPAGLTEGRDQKSRPSCVPGAPPSYVPRRRRTRKLASVAVGRCAEQKPGTHKAGAAAALPPTTAPAGSTNFLNTMKRYSFAAPYVPGVDDRVSTSSSRCLVISQPAPAITTPITMKAQLSVVFSDRKLAAESTPTMKP